MLDGNRSCGSIPVVGTLARDKAPPPPNEVGASMLSTKPHRAGHDRAHCRRWGGGGGVKDADRRLCGGPAMGRGADHAKPPSEALLSSTSSELQPASEQGAMSREAPAHLDLSWKGIGPGEAGRLAGMLGTCKGWLILV